MLLAYLGWGDPLPAVPCSMDTASESSQGLSLHHLGQGSGSRDKAWMSCRSQRLDLPWVMPPPLHLGSYQASACKAFSFVLSSPPAPAVRLFQLLPAPLG